MQRQATSMTTAPWQKQLSPQFLLRVGGLPLQSVDGLRFEETQVWLDTLYALQCQLFSLKEPLVDLLHTAVSVHKENQDLRRALIKYKRDVFNLRPPREKTKSQQIAHVLSQEDQLLLQEWLALWESVEETRVVLAETFHDELRRKRALLKETLAHPDFRKGILLASPQLAQAVDAYFASDNLHLNREARTVERSLVEYLQRTACKTSPFSTFTSVCVGQFTNDVAPYCQDIHYQVASMKKQSFTNLNLAILSRLSAALLASKDLWREVPVQMTTGWQRQDDRIMYVRRKQQIEADEEEAATTIDLVHEEVFYLHAGRCLNLVLHTLKDGQALPAGELVARICEHEAYQHAQAFVEVYVQHLLRLGLLIMPALHLDIHSPHPLRDYYQGLLTLQSPLMQRLAEHLQIIDSLVDAYAYASVQTRQQLLTAIRERVHMLYAELGQSSASIPRTLLYEDTVIRPEKLEINARSWTRVLTDLAEFQQLLPVFDRSLPKKLVTRGYFQARYGYGARYDNFLSFAEAFNSEFFQPYMRESVHHETLDEEGNVTRASNPLNLAEIDGLGDARQAIADAIKEAYTALPAESASLVLEADFFAAISSCLPQTERLQAQTFFSQFARVNEEPLLVINRIYSGLTLMFSRFAHSFPQDVLPALRKTLTALQPGGAVFAELKGGYDTTNLNLHPSVTAYELVCPGELSTRPQEQQIPLTDLFIQDDLQTGRLRLYSRRLGKEIIPVYLGFLLPIMLPDIQQVLLNFSCITFCAYDLWLGVEPTQSGALTFYPRLCYKHLVLQRAMWKLPAEAFPHRASDESDSDFYQRMNQWAKQQHLPSRVFLRIEAATAATASQAARATPTHKPTYIDFANYFSVSLLESILRKASGQIVLSEMLPGPEDLWFEHDGQTYVTELLVEINQLAKEEDHAT